MRLFIAQGRDNNIYITDIIENVPKLPVRLHEFILNDIGKKRELIVTLKKHGVSFDSREDHEKNDN